MAALDFPDNPIPGELWSATNASIYEWTGVYWRVYSKAYIGIPPIGPAGGDLVGNYPNPTIRPDVDFAGQPTCQTPDIGDNKFAIINIDYLNRMITSGKLGGGKKTTIIIQDPKQREKVPVPGMPPDSVAKPPVKVKKLPPG